MTSKDRARPGPLDILLDRLREAFDALADALGPQPEPVPVPVRPSGGRRS